MEDNHQEMIENINGHADYLISVAESLFGPMSSRWQYGGVIFQNQGPHLAYDFESLTVRISLSFKALDDDFQRDFQLAHEVCHLLYPSAELEKAEKPLATVLNEGISTFFSVLIVRVLHGNEYERVALDSLKEFSPNYFRSFQLVSILLDSDPEAIKKIRTVQPMINSVTKMDIKASGLDLPETLVDSLVEIFPGSTMSR